MIKKFCDCGRELQFMEYMLGKSINSGTIIAGCPECNKQFYYIIENDMEMKKMPRMSQIDWLRMNKRKEEK